MLKIFLKDTFQIALLLLSIQVVLSAQSARPRSEVKSKNETYKDIIQKAQSLILQKDRAQAQLILESALNRETKKKVKDNASEELRLALFNMSRMFLSDKAHGLYELSLSLVTNDIPQAIQRIDEGLKIEPDNMQLINQSIRLQLVKNECQSAKSIFQKNKFDNKIHIDSEVDLLLAQIEFCSDKYDFLKLKLTSKDHKKSEKIKLLWSELEVIRAIRERNFAQAKDTLSEMKKIDSDYIELNYLEWLLELKSENLKNLASYSQKYIISCRNLNSTKVRPYILNPWFCQRVAEVENVQNNPSN